MIRGIAKPYAARVKDGSNTITTAVSQKIFIQKVIAALVGIALDFTAPSLLSGISSNDKCQFNFNLWSLKMHIIHQNT